MYQWVNTYLTYNNTSQSYVLFMKLLALYNLVTCSQYKMSFQVCYDYHMYIYATDMH